MTRVFETLRDARPTAVDPVNAMLERAAQRCRPASTVAEQQALALAAAEEFADEDVAHCRAIGEAGAPLIREGMRVLTHCNAGWLAFVDIGSATAPLYAAHRRGERSMSIATKPGRARRAPRSPPGNWRSRGFPIRSSPTTPPASCSPAARSTW